MESPIKLIVFDEQQNYLNTIKNYIQICNYTGKIEVEYENNANNVIEKIKEDNDVLVIVDAFLDGINSIDFLNRAKKEGGQTILVSDSFVPDIEQSALANGALAFIPKMYDEEDLDPLFELIINVAKSQENIVIN